MHKNRYSFEHSFRTAYVYAFRENFPEREREKKENARKNMHVSMKKCGTYNAEVATYPCSRGVQSKKKIIMSGKRQCPGKTTIKVKTLNATHQP